MDLGAQGVPVDAETVGGAADIALVELQGSEDELPFEDPTSLSETDALADQMPDELIKPVAQVSRRVLGTPSSALRCFKAGWVPKR